MALLRGFPPAILVLSLLLVVIVAYLPEPGNASSVVSDAEYSSYLVTVNAKSRPSQFATPLQWYFSLVASVTTVNSTDRITLVLRHHLFQASLTSEEAEKIGRLPGVLSVSKLIIANAPVSAPESGNALPVSDGDYSSYLVIVHARSRPSQFATPLQWYSSLVASVTNVNSSSRITLVLRHHSFHATLTSKEAEKIVRLPGVLRVSKLISLGAPASAPK